MVRRVRVFIMSLALALVVVSTMFVSASIPSGVSCYHGNNNSLKKCYARIEQSGSTYTIGAQITWQYSGSSSVNYGPRVDTSGAEITSYSDSLRGKTGKSYGYYYANNIKIHQSSAWMGFSY